MPLLKAKPGLLRPVQEKFVWQTLVLAWLLPFMMPRHFLFLPDITLLVYVFWASREHHIVGVMTGFVLGLATDMVTGGLWGQHALTYAFIGYLSVCSARRLVSFPVWQQTIAVLLLFYVHALVVALIAMRFVLTHWSLFWLSPVLTALCWPLALVILLFPQRRSHVGEGTPI